jgi:hypothetical protein
MRGSCEGVQFLFPPVLLRMLSLSLPGFRCPPPRIAVFGARIGGESAVVAERRLQP